MKFLKSGKLLFYTYILLFIILNISVAYFINRSIKSDYLDSKLDFSSFQINSVSQNLQKQADIYFDEVINNPKILAEISRIEDKEKKWVEIRTNLIKLLSEPFKRMQKNGVRQLQFHTKDNRSFLRMYSLDKFGDSLKGFRYSVEATNSTLKPHHGFEEGKVKNGFRNVYPIFYQGKHLGSVEISFSFQDVLAKDNFRLMMLRDIIQKKVDLKCSAYKLSSINKHFCFENNKGVDYLISQKIDDKIAENLKGQLEQNNSFSIYIEDKKSANYIINFVSIKNLENKSVAYFVSYTQDEYISEQFYKLILYYIIANSFIILAVILFFHYKKRVNNYIIQEVLRNKINIIFTHKDGVMLRANSKLLDFFNIKSVKDLEIDFICKSFIRADGFLVEENKYCSIINKIEDENIYRVKIKNLKTGKLHIFSVSVSFIKLQNIFLVVLTDITKVTIAKAQVFDEQVYRDNFTSLYNRYKFNLDLKDKTLKQITFSLVLINIDNLADLNQQYGSMIGDNILLEFANLLNVKIRKGDILYRFDTNNFIVMLDDNMMNAKYMAQKLQSIINANRFSKEVILTASFGITEFRKLENKDAILERVQSALNFAKSSGKNCVITV